jgi:uncharacterized membrane protein
LIFLPNAPYVLTDVVHMFDDLRAARTSLGRVVAILVMYALFAAAGLASYVVSMQLFRRSPRAASLPVELFLPPISAHGALGLMRGREWASGRIVAAQ